MRYYIWDSHTYQPYIATGISLIHLPEQLVLQASLGDSKVDDGHLDTDLRQVVRVGELCGHVELKVLVIVYVTVTQADQQSSTLS